MPNVVTLLAFQFLKGIVDKELVNFNFATLDSQTGG
jgi:hypothetical protein